MQKVEVGVQAPDFTLPAQDGSSVTLKGALARGPAVVFFYPKDETPGCTAEACSFRDSYDAFTQAGASVLGISSDSVASHRKFVDKHGFPFQLLSDTGARVRQQWGVPKHLGLIEGRVTYVIGRDGIVRHVFRQLFNATDHIAEALKVVQQLQGAAPDPGAPADSPTSR